ncbi:hypothetical protein FHG55_19280 [Pseudomonas jessenii]|uniref:Uncharacterized protein n=2 Tax=Pseudomonas TaxID=286 RepID=A0A5C4KUM2_PSEJE|nr:hypothetical protein E3Z29_00805 [Pseudomonas sp. S150]QBX44029.1 hypothetical protein E4T63_26945 [Pseudomonas fluorescens]TNB93862.1 hypothetical protein FHG55_19280 [Pseudomonas jessenii]
MGCWQFTAFGQTKHRPPCGSGLARESGESVDIDVPDTALSRASPLPQVDIIVCPGSGNNVQSTAAIAAR